MGHETHFAKGDMVGTALVDLRTSSNQGRSEEYEFAENRVVEMKSFFDNLVHVTTHKSKHRQKKQSGCWKNKKRNKYVRENQKRARIIHTKYQLFEMLFCLRTTSAP